MEVNKARLFDDIIRVLSLVLDYDEGEKLLHGWRVGLVARDLGVEIGARDPSLLLYAGLLHDIGGAGLADHVVHAAERGFVDEQARGHAAAGAEALKPFSVLAPMVDLVADHHERWDGAGFPQRKRNGEIPLGAYAIALADRVDVTLRVTEPDERERAVTRLLLAEGDRAWPGSLSDAGIALLCRPGFLNSLENEPGLGAAVQRASDGHLYVDSTGPVDLLVQLLWLLARVVEIKHPSHKGHSVRVTYLAHHIARALGQDGPDASAVVWAGLLHDVGKAGVPRALLSRPGPLDSSEREVVRRHASDTFAILGSIRDLAHLAGPAAAHHEWYDGRGYPAGLAGEEIPLLSRILAFADVYDALRSARPYKPAMRHEDAMARIRAQIGTHFDPHLAGAALDSLDAHGEALMGDPQIKPLQGLLDADAPDVSHVLGCLLATEGGQPNHSGARHSSASCPARAFDGAGTCVLASRPEVVGRPRRGVTIKDANEGA